MGKDSEYRMLLVENNFGHGGVGTLVARKRIDNIFDVKHVNDRLMIKLFIGKQILAIIST